MSLYMFFLLPSINSYKQLTRLQTVNMFVFVKLLYPRTPLLLLLLLPLSPPPPFHPPSETSDLLIS